MVGSWKIPDALAELVGGEDIDAFVVDTEIVEDLPPDRRSRTGESRAYPS